MRIAKILSNLSVICFLLLIFPVAGLLINFFIYDISPDFHTVGEILEVPFFQLGIWITLMAGLVGGGALLSASAFIFRRFSFSRDGQIAEARVLSLRETGMRFNDNPVVKFTLEVRPAGRKPFRAEARKTLSLVQLSAFQRGKNVIVKFVPGSEDVLIIRAKGN